MLVRATLKQMENNLILTLFHLLKMSIKIVFLVNSLLIAYILYWISSMKDNDFAPLIFISCYLILTTINFTILIALHFLKNEIKKIFVQVCCVLLALLIPLFFIVIKVIIQPPFRKKTVKKDKPILVYNRCSFIYSSSNFQ